ncbi:MAG: hypothetical protein AAFO91_11910, partial [Bacteroidota bacterium]
MPRFALFFFGLFIGFNLHATVFEWVGGTGDWHNPINWQPQGIPDGLDTALIQSGTVQLNQSWFVGRMELDAELQVGSGFSLNINESLVWANGLIEGNLNTSDGVQTSFIDGDLRTLRGRLELRGTTTHTSGLLYIESGQAINIGAYQLNGGVIDVEESADFTNFSQFFLSGGPDLALTGNGWFFNTAASIFSNENGPNNCQID